MNEPSSSKPEPSTGAKKKIKVHKRPSSDSQYSSNDEEEYGNYLPPAARDSKWVGLTYYNPNFENPSGDEVTDEGEIQLMALDDEEEIPLYNLFPKLREKRKSQSLPIIDESTTEITRSLVGQTPNFSHMKKSSKLNPIKLSLPSLKENPNEVIEEKSSTLKNKPSVAKKSSDKTTLKRTLHPTASNTTSKEHHEEETSSGEIDISTRKKKRTKKRSDPGKNLESESSYSALDHPINKQKENLLKPKKNNSKEQKIIIQHSSQGSFADDEAG